MSQVFMTFANKGLVEFSITADHHTPQRRLKVDYQVHTLGDSEAVLREFRQAISEALTSVVTYENANQFVLLPVQPDDFGFEVMAG